MPKSRKRPQAHGRHRSSRRSPAAGGGTRRDSERWLWEFVDSPWATWSAVQRRVAAGELSRESLTLVECQPYYLDNGTRSVVCLQTFAQSQGVEIADLVAGHQELEAAGRLRWTRGTVVVVFPPPS